MTVNEFSGKARFPRLRRLGLRVLLALASLLVTVLILESMVRLFFPVPRPVHEWEGLYASVLPLVNGRPDSLTVLQFEAAGRSALPKDKLPGELRVFVFGESSVEGTPFGHEASPPSLLKDRLQSVLLDRPVTVVNMGRSSSYLRDTWYYLLSIRKLQPDYIVIYQGSNDDFHGGSSGTGAPCVSDVHHALWRFVVLRSHLLWTVRVQGAEWVARRFHSADRSPGSIDEPRQRCSERSAFAAWTRLVVDTAESTGAKVIVVTPVENVLAAPEFAFNQRTRGMDLLPAVNELDPAGRRLLLCALEKECDLPAGIRQEASRARFTGLLFGGNESDRLAAILWKAEAWRSTVRESSALLADFQKLVLQDSGYDLMTWPHIIDEVHLSLGAARTWAQLVGDAILDDLGEASHLPKDEENWLAPVFERNRGRKGLADAMLSHAAGYVHKRMFLMAAIGLREAVAMGSSRAPALQECLRLLTAGESQECQPSLNQQLQDALSANSL